MADERKINKYASLIRAAPTRAARNDKADNAETIAEEREDPPGTEPHKLFALSELGNAERFIAQHGERVRYCNPWKKWLLWDGRRWLRDDRQLIKTWARDTVRSIYREAALPETIDLRKKTANHAIKSETQSVIHAMLGLAQMDCPIMPDELDTDPWAFNVLNGTIDLRTGTLRPHDKAALLSKLCPLTYDPEARAEVWERFLDETFGGNQELLDWLHRAIGYSLTGTTSEQKFFLCYGTGSNGKSSFLTVLQALMGEYAENADFQTFLYMAKDKVRNDVAKLALCRFVSAVEADEGQEFNDALIRKMSGEDLLTARHLFSEEFTYMPQFKIWLASSQKPVIRGRDHGMWRRIKLIPFLRTVPDAEQDGLLGKKLKAELPGILAWAVRGCLAWQEKRLIPEPEAVTLATGMYRSEQDWLGNFFEECCVLQSDFTVPSSDLYRAYKQWSETNTEKSVSQTAFAIRLKERNLKNNKNTLTDRMQWTGIGLKHTDNTR